MVLENQDNNATHMTQKEKFASICEQCDDNLDYYLRNF